MGNTKLPHMSYCRCKECSRKAKLLKEALNSAGSTVRPSIQKYRQQLKQAQQREKEMLKNKNR